MQLPFPNTLDKNQAKDVPPFLLSFLLGAWTCQYNLNLASCLGTMTLTLTLTLVMTATKGIVTLSRPYSSERARSEPQRCRSPIFSSFCFMNQSRDTRCRCTCQNYARSSLWTSSWWWRSPKQLSLRTDWTIVLQNFSMSSTFILTKLKMPARTQEVKY